jgi:hypothetical protein
MVTRARYTLPATRLTPIVKVRDDDYVLLVPPMAAVPNAVLGEVVGNPVRRFRTRLYSAARSTRMRPWRERIW